MKNIIILGVFTATMLLISLFFDKKKTLLGIKRGYKMFQNILVPFLNIIIIISIVLYLIPQETITRLLGQSSGFFGVMLAALIGSITLIPGFVSYPLAATLMNQGATVQVVATFMTTLMMVGVVTFPVEFKYFGKKATILRNVLNFIAAILIGYLVGRLY